MTAEADKQGGVGPNEPPQDASEDERLGQIGAPGADLGGGDGPPTRRGVGRDRGRRPRSVHRFRWVFQTVFLVLFLGLLTLTVWPLGTVFFGSFLLADPLVAFNSLVQGAVKWELLLAVPVLLSPLFLGRVFCGYACPLGFLVELCGPRRERHPGPRTRGVLRKLPLFTLVVVAFLILFGSAVFLVFDPLSLVTRSATTLVYPAADRVLTGGGNLLYHIPQLQGTVDGVTNILTGRLVFPNGLRYRLQLVILFMFVAVLAVSYVERRMWCRHLCPLGALLGLMGRGAFFGRVVDEERCTSCGVCESICPMDAIRDDGRSTDTSRCECGLECKDACPEKAIRWGFRPGKQYEYDPSRRALLKAGGLALAGSFFLFSGLGRIERKNTLIRPPGSRNELSFLATCARCGQCLKVCPTNVLQPAVWEAGPEGMFTPSLDFRRGYCDWNCNECGKVCPTQAIQRLDLPRKQQTVIGRAYVDRSVCIPWSEGTECLVCQELCPTPSKAVILAQGNPLVQGGRPGTDGEDGGQLMLPYVAPELCIGCGVCQYNCPVPNRAAIIVRAVATTDTANST